MKVHERVKFPCGYEIERDYKAGALDISIYNSDLEFPNEYPLHGKSCNMSNNTKN